MNNKVGLVIAHTGTSYGMNLQAFATQYVIEKLGFDTEILRTKSHFPEGIYLGHGIIHHFIAQAKRRRQKKIHNLNRLTDDFHKKNNEERIKAAQTFRKDRLHNFSPVMDYKGLCKYSDRFKAVLVGSDQCWLPGFSFSYFNTLRFVPNSVKRISYATSLGVSEYPNYCRKSARDAWKKFDFLSVREEQGANVIREICGDIDVRVVLDPTYLISKEEWLSLIPIEENQSDNYILSFMLGNDDSQKEMIKKFARAKELKLVSILSNESSSSIDTTYADVLVTGASPEKFVNLIRGANYIFTDSFHGIAFSIINNKNFYCFYPKRDFAKGKSSRNSRIDNILHTFHLSDHLINDYGEDYEIEDKVIDYNTVNNILSDKRDESLQFLKLALQ